MHLASVDVFLLVVQRAMAANSMNAARRAPLIAAMPNMLFPFLVIVPGLVALGLTLHPNAGAAPLLPRLADGTYDYNMALPLMMSRYYLTAYAAMRFNNIMNMLQLVFSFVNAPLLATFLLGMFWKRTTGHGAFWGLVLGTCAAALHDELTAVMGAGSLLPKVAVVHSYRSDMAQNFWGAIVAWTACFAATTPISLVTKPKADAELRGLVYALTPRCPAATFHGTIALPYWPASSSRSRRR